MNVLKNLFSWRGTRYQFKTDTTPTESSSSFITSGAVYELFSRLSQFFGRRIVVDPVNIANASQDIPTGNAVFKYTTEDLGGAGRYSAIQQKRNVMYVINRSEFSSVGAENIEFKSDTSIDKSSLSMLFPIYIMNDTGSNSSKCNIAYYLSSRNGSTVGFYATTSLQTGVLYFDMLTGKPFAYMGNKYNGDSIRYLA